MLQPSDVPGALGTLDQRQRDVLVVLALQENPYASRSHWCERVSDAGIVDERGRRLGNEPFKAMIERLVAGGAVRRNARGDHSIAEAWLAPVLEDAHRRGRLAPIAGAVVLGRRFYTAYAMRGQVLAALVLNDAAALSRALAFYNNQRPGGARWQELVDVLGLEAPLTWISRIDPVHRRDYVRDALECAFVEGRHLGPGLHAAALASEDEEAVARLATILALTGDGQQAGAVLDKCGTSQWARGARAFLNLTEGRLDEAREAFRSAALGARGQRVDLPGYLAIFDVLLAVTSDRADEVADVARRMQKGRRHLAWYWVASAMLEQLGAFRTAGAKASNPLPPGRSWIDDLFVALGQRWMGLDETVLVDTRPQAGRLRSNGYKWLADEMDRIGRGEQHGSLLALFGTKAAWELALDSLQAAVSEGEPSVGADKPKKKPLKDAELWWTVAIHPESRWVDIEACVATGVAVKGTKISFARLLERPGVRIDEHDRRAAERLTMLRDRGDYFMPCSAMLSLVGHPRVRDEVGRRLVVEASEPKLRVDRTATGARIVLCPPHFDGSGCAVEQEGNRVVVYTRTPIVARVQGALPPNGIEVPSGGLARMNEVLAAIGGALGVETAKALASETVAADPRIHVQLFRASASMRVRLCVVPAGSGSTLRPGAPPADTVVVRDGHLVRMTRDLAAERARLDALLERCPTLASLPREGDDLVARELETCLELLVELREAETDAVVEWLEGQPLRAPAVRSGSQVRVRVTGDATWLSVEGEVQVDEGRVVEMRALLEGASRARGRFVPIGGDEWLALTDDLRKKLDALHRVRGLGKDGRVSTALLSSMEGLLEGLDVSFADVITERREALERARSLDVRLPRQLLADLRDYQRDGFVFLTRRTEAGLGACLADDMGLGKTVQTLALLLHRRTKGPALVVAPTSVCRNWEDEARRFTPSLAIQRLADGDRDARDTVVRDAAKGTIVVISYGLLASEEKLLASRTWGTVIFDEAHALKNATTRRWAAARALRSDAIVALSGTPVENHAGELHALFDLLVPGMLGSRGAFDRAIGAAIAEGDREAAALLRQVVRPFVLRRTKAQVLTELPPKTEVLHVVPASKEHLAFYETVRRNAVQKIEVAKKAGGASAARARIDLLAEITRLRRAAIDPRLVAGEGAPEGAKLDALAELVSELRSEGRRALVFSQFLEVLDFARKKLEESGVECLRLDGTMSEAIRAEAVSAFQSGRGDVFLVSLKAGGVGMNLTAADVVILLDPWWNPAVEDQAAGRAHRIGQTRPVTVARIVTEHTIEEKVLALHAKKRQLFDDVVAGADGTGTLDIETIGALLADDPDASPRRSAHGADPGIRA